MNPFTEKRDLFLEHIQVLPHGAYVGIACTEWRYIHLVSQIHLIRPDVQVEWLGEAPRERALPYSTRGIL
jgi:hypothetical protein